MIYKKPAFWVIAVAATACVVTAVLLLANPAKTLALLSASSDDRTSVGAPKYIDALATAYAFDKCLYIDTATSYYPIEGTGQLYLCNPDSLTIVNEETGEIQENYSLVAWEAKEVDTDEWNGMFWTESVDISAFQSRIEYNIGSRYRLYQMDEEVWLGHFNSDMLLRLYRLKETDLFPSDIVGQTDSSAPKNEHGTENGINSAHKN